MERKPFLTIALSLLCVLSLISTHTQGQVIHAGLKAGGNLSWVAIDDADYRDNFNVRPVPGFHAGASFSFKVKQRFFIHTDLLYTTKGKIITNDVLGSKDRVLYNHIDLPLTFNVFFDAKLKMKNVRYFKWYAGFGPNFSYWLNGKGTLTSLELSEYNSIKDYKIVFEPFDEEIGAENDKVFIGDPNRLQLGLNIGGGIMIEPMSGDKIMMDLRFEYGHSWLSRETYATYVYPSTYEQGENLHARNMGLRLSFTYMLEFNTDKKIMNKGKSTKDGKRNAVQRNPPGKKKKRR